MALGLSRFRLSFEHGLFRKIASHFRIMLEGASMPATSPGPRRNGRWRIFIAPVLLLVVAVAWSAFWFYAASRVDVVTDAWRAKEAKAGRVYDCGRRSVAGFPFRLEVSCDDVSVQLISQTAGQA